MGATPAGRGLGDYISPACAFWFEQVEAERPRLIASIAAAYDQIAEEVATEIATARATSAFPCRRVHHVLYNAYA